MVTLKQWGVIVFAAIVGFMASAQAGTALAFGVATYGLVLGYNGVDLSRRVGALFSKTE